VTRDCARSGAASKKVLPRQTLVRRVYAASGGAEHFVSIESADRATLLGFVRLRLPPPWSDAPEHQPPFEELRGAALVRENCTCAGGLSRALAGTCLGHVLVRCGSCTCTGSSSPPPTRATPTRSTPASVARSWPRRRRPRAHTASGESGPDAEGRPTSPRISPHLPISPHITRPRCGG